MSEKIIPPDTWRLELIEKAKAIAGKADTAGRTHYTPEEVAQMEEVLKDLHAALTVEKRVRDEGEDEGTV